MSVVDFLVDGEVASKVSGACGKDDLFVADSLEDFELEFVLFGDDFLLFFAEKAEDSVDEGIGLFGEAESGCHFVGQVLDLEDALEVQDRLAFEQTVDVTVYRTRWRS